MKKDQYIALCADSAADAECLLPYARRLAECFHKGIILFTCAADGDQWVGRFGVPFAALKSDWASVVEAMPVAFNVVLALVLTDPHAPRASLSRPRNFLKAFRQSKVAYIAFPHTLPLNADDLTLTTKHLSFTLDHRRESKEKVLWASYFHRFCQSDIHLYYHPYTDPALRQRLNNNIRYLEKIFSSLSLTFIQHPLEGGSQYSDPDLRAIGQDGTDLFIALVPDTRDRDLLDILSPSPSLRLLRNAGEKPILFLNQRDDLYVLCD